MRALLVEQLADDFAGCALRELPDPVAGAGQVVLSVRAAAVNFPDLLMTHGGYQLKPPLPFVPGMECSGVVESVGDGVDVAWIGREVVAGTRLGAMADRVVVAADQLRAKPARLGWGETAAYRAVYLTAWVALVRRAQLQAGEWVLVHGAAGGTGLACVDLARHLGARVNAVASTAEKRDAITRLYAPDAVIAPGDGLREAVLDITGGRGADVVFDPVGGEAFEASLRCTAFDGRLLVIGFAGGTIPSVSANIPLIKGFSVVGVRAGEYGRRFPDKGAENLAAIDALATDGGIRPHVHAALPLDQWRDAFEMIRRREVVGKLVLVP